MLTVTHKEQTEPLNQIANFELNEEVNGALTVSFTSFSLPNNPGHELLHEEAIVEIEGYEFRIKQTKESTRGKSVMALSSYFDLVGHYQDLTYGGTRTLNDFVTYALTGTGWSFTSDVTKTATLVGFGRDNTVKLIQQICSAFECEFQILPDNKLHFAEKIGPDNNAQYRYRHNVKTLSKSVDTTNMRMSIVGKGADDLTVSYTSPNASKYPHIGAAEPVSDERFTIPENLLEYTKSKLIDYPETTIELETVEIGDKALGERVWLIYEPLGLEYQTRVMSKKSVLRNGRLVTATATIGNVVPRDLSDVVTDVKEDIDENKERTRSRFEQTDEKILLAVERFDGEILKAYSKIELTADEIRSEVGALDVKLSDGIAKNTSLISQTATQIRSEVNSEIRRVNGQIENLSSSITQTATSIRSEVNSEIKRVDGRIDTANSSITQTATSIRAEVSASITQLDGRVNTAVSSVEQTASSLRSEVATQVSTLDGKITSANSSITQLSGQISAKADYSEVTALGSRVNSVEFSMSAVDGKIASKVSGMDYNGSVIASLINQTASIISINAQAIDLSGIVRVADSIDLGYSGSGGTKAIRFNGSNAWIYSGGDFGLTLDASYIRVLGELTSYSPSFGSGMPVITGTSRNQNLSLGLTPNGQLNVYRPDGSMASFKPI